MIRASAPGKVILLGEHAVVYGRPAIAAPLRQVQAEATVETLEGTPAGSILIEAPDIGQQIWLRECGADDPLGKAVRLALDEVGEPHAALRLTIRSTIPIAAGLGSGAAVSAAILRALALAAGNPISDEWLCKRVYDVEKIYHGTPSGIDNTVVVYARPIFFMRDEEPTPFTPAQPFTLVLADTGVRSPTARAVGAVRKQWQADRAGVEHIFDHIAQIVERGYQAIQSGDLTVLGDAMDENQSCLEQIQVSSPELDGLIQAARKAGALGAKLTGAGQGGVMAALADPQHAEHIRFALMEAGAPWTAVTEVR